MAEALRESVPELMPQPDDGDQQAVVAFPRTTCKKDVTAGI